jgi:chromosome segregation ATPase
MNTSRANNQLASYQKSIKNISRELVNISQVNNNLRNMVESRSDLNELEKQLLEMTSKYQETQILINSNQETFNKQLEMAQKKFSVREQYHIHKQHDNTNLTRQLDLSKSELEQAKTTINKFKSHSYMTVCSRKEIQDLKQKLQLSQDNNKIDKSTFCEQLNTLNNVISTYKLQDIFISNLQKKIVDLKRETNELNNSISIFKNETKELKLEYYIFKNTMGKRINMEKAYKQKLDAARNQLLDHRVEVDRLKNLYNNLKS